jgi:hypothetical protein
VIFNANSLRFTATAALGLLTFTCVVAQRSWSLVNPFGLQQNDGTFMAGRMWDAIEMSDGQVLAASDITGVWWLRRGQQAVPLSTNWTDSVIFSLAANTAVPRNFFAAGLSEDGSRGILYSTRLSTAAPLFEPWDQVTLPPGTGVIRRILTLNNPPRLIVASDQTIYWTDLNASGIYTWHAAQGSVRGPFFDLDEGPAGTIMVGTIVFAAGSDNASPVRKGVWTGSGTSTQLQLMNVTFNATSSVPYDIAAMNVTSVAVSSGNRNIMYCSGGNAAGMCDRFYQSTNGGLSWNPKMMNDAAGGGPIGPRFEGRQGVGFNNSLAASPTDLNTVVLGWVHSWISRDGGNTFTRIGGVHDDHHGLAFFGNLLYDCSDGGIWTTKDVGTTWSDEYARKAPNLLFNQYTFDCFVRGRTFLSGGLQDHSCIYCSFEPSGQPAPWKFFEGVSRSDGGPTHLSPGSAIWTFGDTGRYHFSTLNSGNDFADQGWLDMSGVSSEETAPGNPFVNSLKMVRITAPDRRDSAGGLMTALTFTDPNASATTDHSAHIYGLFERTPRPVLAHVADVTIPAGCMVTTLGSYDGNTIYVGLSGSSLMKSLNVDTGTVTDETGLTGSNIDLIACGGPSDAFAASFDGSNGTLFQLAGKHTWTAIPSGPRDRIWGLTCDGPTYAFAATTTGVFESHNDRTIWTPINGGLPRNLHSSALLVCTDGTGRKWLYLATYGWSIWRCALN